MSLQLTMLDESLLLLQETRAPWNVSLSWALTITWTRPDSGRRCCPAANVTRWPALA